MSKVVSIYKNFFTGIFDQKSHCLLGMVGHACELEVKASPNYIGAVSKSYCLIADQIQTSDDLAVLFLFSVLTSFVLLVLLVNHMCAIQTPVSVLILQISFH